MSDQTNDTIRQVCARVHEQRLQLEVIDDGPGVDPGMEDDIFEPYVSRPGNGRRPASDSYRMQARENRSLLPSTAAPRICSGDI